MQKYTQQLDRDHIHKKHPYRRQKKFFKDLSPSKEQLLQKYQKELQDLLSHSPTKHNKCVPPTQSHIFLDWQEYSPSNRKHRLYYDSIESKHTKKVHQPVENIHYQRRSHSLRKSDKLVLSRYNIFNEQRLSRKYRHSNHSDKHSPISNNQSAFILPPINQISTKSNRHFTQEIHIMSNKLHVETEQNTPTFEVIQPIRQQVLQEGFKTVTVSTPSRNSNPNLMNLSTADKTINIKKPQLEKDYLNEIRNSVTFVIPQQLNNTINESEFTQTQQSGALFSKKTVFYTKLYQEKLALSHEQMSKIIKKPVAIPSKQSLTEFLNNYQSLDPAFNSKALIQSPIFGIIRFKDAIYIGDCPSGEEGKQLRHGKGVYISNKLQFQGDFQHNEKKYGTEVTQQGIYKGEFKKGMRNGKGQFRWHNGQYYNGQWHNNKKHGSGMWTSSILSTSKNQVPDSYMGQWQSGNVHGYGVHTWNYGKNCYEGQFTNFLKHGRGIEKFQNGDRYEGQYKEGKADGYGEYYWADGSYYKGSFVAGLRDGIGIWLEPNKDKYEGFLKEDCKHGHGILQYANGDIFQGEFFMDSREGPGVLIPSNGQDIIQGIWKHNHLQTD